jgi:hypothetical protein
MLHLVDPLHLKGCTAQDLQLLRCAKLSKTFILRGHRILCTFCDCNVSCWRAACSSSRAATAHGFEWTRRQRAAWPLVVTDRVALATPSNCLQTSEKARNDTVSTSNITSSLMIWFSLSLPSFTRTPQQPTWTRDVMSHKIRNASIATEAAVYAQCKTVKRCSDILAFGSERLAEPVARPSTADVRCSFIDAVKYLQSYHGPTDSVFLRSPRADELPWQRGTLRACQFPALHALRDTQRGRGCKQQECVSSSKLV